MKTWWQGLSSRERSLLSGLAVLAVIALMYFIIWQPITNSVTTLQQHVNSQRALLAWMQQATTVLQHNSAALDTAAQFTPPEQRLAIIQTTLTNTNFNKYVTQLEQTNQNDVHLVISTADFDSLTDWLVLLWKQHGIIVSDLDLKKLNNQGLVSVNMVLTGGKLT